jgi:hypothetical protein
MSLSELHILSFDVPSPPDYGGVIDVYYKLKALKKAEVKVHLHCFQYGRKADRILNDLCVEVCYYPRKTAKSLLFNTYPYIVLSRNSPELRKRLLEDELPVLMEGIHSTYLLNDPAFASRQIIVRTHNVEHDYYENLARVEKNIFKRYYFYNEAGKLLKYENVLKKADGIAAISEPDYKHFREVHNNVFCISAFHPFDDVKIKKGRGDFAFYHGNLSIGENNEAALYLVQKVFDDLPYKLVIAGNKPSEELKKAVKGNALIELHDYLPPEKIHKLISNAQCNVLPTFQSTGIKLKLLAALHSGRACIVNTPMVENTGLEPLCIIANDPHEMKKQITNTMETDFPSHDTERRKAILSDKFSNKKNAVKLLELFEKIKTTSV